jgi:hypothetical protein
MQNQKDLWERYKQAHRYDEIPNRPFQKMVYDLILAVELNTIAHKNRNSITRATKYRAYKHKNDHMLAAYQAVQRCQFKRVHTCIEPDPKNDSVMVMRFRFDKLKGSHPYVGIRNRRGKKSAIMIDQKYNHIVVSLHFPKEYVEKYNLPTHPYSGVHGNMRQVSTWSAEVLAKHYGLEYKKF